MDRTVRVLIIEPEPVRTMALESCVEGMRMRARSVSTVQSSLGEMREADILVVDYAVADGSSTLCISNWMDQNGGPVLVLANPSIPVVSENALLRSGASNVLRDPEDEATLQSMLRQYCRWILQVRRLDSLEQSFRRITLLVIAESLLLAAIGGPKVVETLIRVLF